MVIAPSTSLLLFSCGTYKVTLSPRNVYKLLVDTSCILVCLPDFFLVSLVLSDTY